MGAFANKVCNQQKAEGGEEGGSDRGEHGQAEVPAIGDESDQRWSCDIAGHVGDEEVESKGKAVGVRWGQVMDDGRGGPVVAGQPERREKNAD